MNGGVHDGGVHGCCSSPSELRLSFSKKKVARQEAGGAASREEYAKEVRRSLARSTRALPIRLVTVGKHRDPAVEKVVLDYGQKVRRYCSFEEVQVRPNPKNTSDVATQVAAEGDQVLRGISSKDWVVLLDERGKDMTSEQLATLIADAGEKGASAVVFCIGGPFGHGPQVSARANTSVRLSAMVLNHEVARIVLVEQIYRAWTILRGEKYHH